MGRAMTTRALEDGARGEGETSREDLKVLLVAGLIYGTPIVLSLGCVIAYLFMNLLFGLLALAFAAVYGIG